MTTDPTPLQERIARALTEHWRRKHSTLLTSGPCSGCSRVTADAVTAEVRKAQADAWDEGSGGRDDLRPNPYRADEIEKEN